ncbi:pantothenate kinase [Nodularia spumigena CS-584]|uniref:pantothenate kinase n=1 Tax=Nodularia spumigena TaxID=70799 RepID=UPI0000EA903B|nr:pantothenate kinase [Nodularia spumigena]AHJ27293.1 Pantothenate kinase type III, CoaX-like protein [Nodularia spumigena CCY9414]EAW43519.1 Putative transcriptional acitvator, Baf [Nodularia spumigena CCY9414]MDB9382497.1 pantothenate kinase [Nodularia spumigena CS-584]MEA5557477.1 pantothenate kinase [Nodularia spumigena CH309]
MKPQRRRGHRENIWLALEIGNSRLHWALFTGQTLSDTWDTDPFSEYITQQLAQCQTFNDLPPEIFPPSRRRKVGEKNSPHPPIFLASVVPQQTALWETHPHVRVITLEQIPLLNMYPTLGIDRALALWGAGKTWGFPMLVIDAGTALTFTGADAKKSLVGGAILPGLGLQFSSLGEKTGQLPHLETEISSLPPRFALNTTEAIQSGIIYTLLAGIKDFVTAWEQLFPESKIVIKGGDRILLLNYLQIQFPEIAAHLIMEPNLIFWGMREIITEH